MPAIDERKTELDIHDILRLLPHRYPMLFIDRVIDIDFDKECCVGIKNVTINEPYFQGHFPGKPVAPGVFQIEAMAQTSALYILASRPDLDLVAVYLMTVDNVRYRKPVLPGNSVKIHVTVTKKRPRNLIYKFSSRAMVGDTLVTEADFTAMGVERGANI